LDLKFDHPGSESAGIDAEDFGGPELTFDPPTSILQGVNDVVALHLFESFGGAKEIF
jgi:hypothetical protein